MRRKNRLWLGGQVSRSGVYMQYMSTAEYRSQQRHKKETPFFQEASFEYIIHNAQEKLFVTRHQASEARSVLLVREH